MILVTTSKSLLFIDNNKNIKKIHQGSGIYFGLARKGDGSVYVAARNSLVRDSLNLIDPGQEDGEILVFNNSLDLVESFRPKDFKLQDLHGISFWKNNLICISSYNDILAIYDGKDWKRWIPLDKTKEMENRDCYHFNSIYAEDSLYLLAHNWRNGSFVLKFKDLYETHSSIIANMGTESHSLWKEDSTIYALSSNSGRVVGSNGASINIGGWVRGICTVDDLYYVGVSHFGPRHERHFSNGKIAIYDKNWNFLDEIILEGEGQVLEIINFR